MAKFRIIRTEKQKFMSTNHRSRVVDVRSIFVSIGMRSRIFWRVAAIFDNSTTRDRDFRDRFFS